VNHELHELAHFGLKAVRFFLRVRHEKSRDRACSCAILGVSGGFSSRSLGF
jgi:hypothetical protein